MTPKPIFTDNQDGTATFTGFFQVGSQNVKARNQALTGSIKNISEILKNGGLVVQPQHNNMKNNQWSKDVTTAQNIAGHNDLVRREVVEGNQAALKPLNIVIENNSAAAYTALFFDGLGDIETDKGIVAPPAGVTVGGSTFGARTLARLNQAAQQEPIRLHTLQAEAYIIATGAGDDSYFSTNPIEIAQSDVRGVVVAEPIEMSLNQDGSQFQAYIRRVADFRFVGAPRTGILVTVPAGRRVNLNFKMQAVASGRLMNLV